MKLHFYVRFRTNFGQTLSVLGNTDLLGNDKASDAIPMQYLNNDYWHLSLDANPAQSPRFRYKYMVSYADG
ncbi:MAG TPA: carbohydrate-binding module family 20 domain-containing protein, partial [Chitinophagaceae bacterium]|nr:carbohydrate-binding module family 20 domain-containing protein [Chitinophagaceae bacterium]